MTYMTRNCLPFLKPSRFGDTIWKVWPIPFVIRRDCEQTLARVRVSWTYISIIIISLQ